MEQAQPPRRGTSAYAARRTAWILVALALVSINLRPAITTIAGTMGQLQAGFGLDAHLLPLLGALPVLAFGVSALAVRGWPVAWAAEGLWQRRSWCLPRR
ncbi:hypothetical protein AHiyo8_25730 [Arthrobacter sp. Hiyo8]|nr:hypothetical protein AHiyo8_25730 [Arthrobacter sp. Hiyo8]